MHSLGYKVRDRHHSLPVPAQKNVVERHPTRCTKLRFTHHLYDESCDDIPSVLEVSLPSSGGLDDDGSCS